MSKNNDDDRLSFLGSPFYRVFSVTFISHIIDIVAVNASPFLSGLSVTGRDIYVKPFLIKSFVPFLMGL